MKRDLLLYQEEQSRQGRPLSGLAALFMAHMRFTLDRGQALAVDLSTLIGLEYTGDL